MAVGGYQPERIFHIHFICHQECETRVSNKFLMALFLSIRETVLSCFVLSFENLRLVAKRLNAVSRHTYQLMRQDFVAFFYPGDYDSRYFMHFSSAYVALTCKRRLKTTYRKGIEPRFDQRKHDVDENGDQKQLSKISRKRIACSTKSIRSTTMTLIYRTCEECRGCRDKIVDSLTSNSNLGN